MVLSDDLRKLIGEFLEIEPETIIAQFPLTGPRMQGSVARYSLDAALRRRLGITCPAVYTAATFGELEAALLGPEFQADYVPHQPPISTLARIIPAETEKAASQINFNCGIDIELIDVLPSAEDYWTHPFYVGCFTQAEIAYCLMQEAPRMHFAGRWCAKEAAKKCLSGLLTVDMNHLEVGREVSGSVFLQLHRQNGAERLPCSLSISHTSLMAVAIVISHPAHHPAEG